MNEIVFEELKALEQDAGPKDFVFSNSRTGVNTIPSRLVGAMHAKRRSRGSKVPRHSSHVRNSFAGQWCA